LLTGQRLDSVAQMALYRPQFLGDPMLIMVSEINSRSAGVQYDGPQRTGRRRSPRRVRRRRARALYVNLVFNLLNRLANAFDFSWDSDGQVRLGAKVIHRISYRLPRFLMR
jgi:hypothetical protein